jgi:hypothetical protein
MTQEQPEARNRLPVFAQPGSRVEELLAAYEPAKAAAEEASGRYKAITDAIKAELASANPGVREMLLSGMPGLPQLRMTWVEPLRFDTKRFKEDHPVEYVRYTRQGGNWDLRQA